MSRSQLKSNIQNKSNSLLSPSHSKKGRVYSVILDSNHFFFTDILDRYDSSYIGWIYWGDLNLKQGGLRKEDILKYCTLAKPYSNNITYHPLRTEIVDLVKAPSNKYYPKFGGNSTNAQYYYHSPINVWNGSSYNALPSETDLNIAIESQISLIGDYIDEDKISGVTNMLPFEGDMILEGRFGNSIRFGSSTPRGKNNWSENDSEGDPITIISNGQPQGETPLENINEDDSSIYLTSNQNISNFKLASSNFKSLSTEFNEPSSGLDPILSFSQNNGIIDIINGSSNDDISTDLDNDGDENSGTDDEGSDIVDENGGGNPEGFEDLVKLPKQYIDNNKKLKDIYILPKKFTNSGTILVTNSIAKPLLRMLLAAEKEGTILKVNSGFRPPIEDIYDINNNLLQISQKTIRLNNLKSQYNGKLKEPWLKNTTVIEAFPGYQVGDSITLSLQSTYFTPVTAPSYRSPHGASIGVDFSTASGTNNAFKWLCKYGWLYGFIREVKSEAWHFNYRPSKARRGATATLSYKPGVLGTGKVEGHNSWNNVFGNAEPNWPEELKEFEQKEAENLNA